MNAHQPFIRNRLTNMKTQNKGMANSQQQTRRGLYQSRVLHLQIIFFRN